MNLDNIKDIIEKAGSDAMEQTTERRNMLKSFGAKVALASIPVLGSSLFNKASAQTTNNVITALNDALQMEYLQAEFYKQALAVENLIPANLRSSFEKIAADENGHISLITYLIDSLSGNTTTAGTYDFTGGNGLGGPYSKVLTNYWEFLEVAQVLKETCLRSYKTLLITFIPNNTVMNNMVNIHSTEARHAAFIRILRKDFDVKPWVTRNESGINKPAAVAPYAGEENIQQGNMNITDINGYKISVDIATESFDEPITKENAADIFNKFMM
jgi:hypothetical protein